MATSALRSRVKWIISISVFSILLTSVWLVRFTSPGTLYLIPTMPRPRVDTRQGTVVGVEVEQGFPQPIEKFLGIPYALSTDGERRFSPPVPVSLVKVFDASQYGQRCPSGQRDSTPEGEDCLNLNIFRPKNRDESKKLPVLVYLHGGAFNFGAGNTRHIVVTGFTHHFDSLGPVELEESEFSDFSFQRAIHIPHLVAWSAEPMIGISFNYRVGAFGFLPSTFMEEEGLLNVGLKDQALLFEWVQKNIAAFGGDPDNVTIMGSSAGAHSVGHHLLHNTDKPPPFQRAILESGAATARAVYTPSNPINEQQFQEFLQLLNVPFLPTSQILSSLRSKPFLEIKVASGAIFEKYNPSVRWPFQPVIDGPGGMIPVAPITAWKSGSFHRVPILTGFNANEGSMFVPETASKSQEFTDFFRTLLPSLPKHDLVLLNEVYPDPLLGKDEKYKETRRGLGAQFMRLEQAYGHFAYVAPVLQTALFASSPSSPDNSTSVSKAEKEEAPPVYLYEFALPSNSSLLAYHGSHAPFITHNPEIARLSPTTNNISNTMHAYWTSFILTGDPNALPGKGEGERVVWPRFSDGGNGKENMLVFGEGNTELIGWGDKGDVVKVASDKEVRKECGFWMERTELFEI